MTLIHELYSPIILLPGQKNVLSGTQYTSQHSPKEVVDILFHAIWCHVVFQIDILSFSNNSANANFGRLEKVKKTKRPKRLISHLLFKTIQKYVNNFHPHIQ